MSRLANICFMVILALFVSSSVQAEDLTEKVVAKTEVNVSEELAKHHLELRKK